MPLIREATRGHPKLILELANAALEFIARRMGQASSIRTVVPFLHWAT